MGRIGVAQEERLVARVHEALSMQSQEQWQAVVGQSRTLVVSEPRADEIAVRRISDQGKRARTAAQGQRLQRESTNVGPRMKQQVDPARALLLRRLGKTLCGGAADVFMVVIERAQ